MLSKTALSAVKAFVVLAELPADGHMGVKAVAEKIGAGQNYLGKLLQSLIDEGLVLSRKGLGGGFRLNRNPASISLFDVVEPIDHVSRWDGCFMGREECSEETPCAVHEQWKSVRDGYLKFLKETTIRDLNSGKPLQFTLSG